MHVCVVHDYVPCCGNWHGCWQWGAGLHRQGEACRRHGARGVDSHCCCCCCCHHFLSLCVVLFLIAQALAVSKMLLASRTCNIADVYHLLQQTPCRIPINSSNRVMSCCIQLRIGVIPLHLCVIILLLAGGCSHPCSLIDDAYMQSRTCSSKCHGCLCASAAATWPWRVLRGCTSSVC